MTSESYTKSLLQSLRTTNARLVANVSQEENILVGAELTGDASKFKEMLTAHATGAIWLLTSVYPSVRKYYGVDMTIQQYANFYTSEEIATVLGLTHDLAKSQLAQWSAYFTDLLQSYFTNKVDELEVLWMSDAPVSEKQQLVIDAVCLTRVFTQLKVDDNFRDMFVAASEVLLEKVLSV
jgi:hypothetical protein